MISILFKALRKGYSYIGKIYYTPLAKIILFLNGAKFSTSLKVNGILKVHITRKGIVNIGKNLNINSGKNHNIIGRQQKTIFWIDGELKIGNNTGMSSTAIICRHRVSIGNNVTIGGNTVIYDTDFHSLNPLDRLIRSKDLKNTKKGTVIIEDNVFIGAHSTILKGVRISKNSIVGACSVVSKNIPPNEIWAGNPIKFLKKIDEAH